MERGERLLSLAAAAFNERKIRMRVLNGPKARRWVWAGAALLLTAGLAVTAGTPAHADGPGQAIVDNIRYSSNAQWQGWDQPPTQPSGTIASYPDVSADAAADSIHVDVVTTTGLWDTERNSNGTWGPWAQPPQPPALPGGPDDDGVYQTYSAGLPDGDIDFFQIWDGEIWWVTRYSDGGWDDWDETGLLTQYGTVSLAVTTVDLGGDYDDEITAITNEGTLWHSIYDETTDEWQAWASPAPVPGGGAEAVTTAGLVNGNTEFLAVSRSGVIWHNIRFANGSWQGWEEPKQPPAGWYSTANNYGLGSAADYNGNAQFILWDLNLSTGATTLYHTIRYASGSWQDAWGTPTIPADQNCVGSAAIPTFNPNDTNLYLDAVCLS
jgi:hypothetical protein